MIALEMRSIYPLGCLSLLKALLRLLTSLLVPALAYMFELEV